LDLHPFILMYPGRHTNPAPRSAALSMGKRKPSAVSALTAVKTGNEGEIGAMGITPSAQTRLKQGVQGKKPPVGRATAPRHPLA
jgi:hypothetical protein